MTVLIRNEQWRCQYVHPAFKVGRVLVQRQGGVADVVTVASWRLNLCLPDYIVT